MCADHNEKAWDLSPHNEGTTMESQRDFENKITPPANLVVASDTITLNEIEKLKFQNIHLQKKILNMQQQDLDKQEILLVSEIKNRVGVDITGWNVDINTGKCTPKQ